MGSGWSGVAKSTGMLVLLLRVLLLRVLLKLVSAEIRISTRLVTSSELELPDGDYHKMSLLQKQRKEIYSQVP